MNISPSFLESIDNFFDDIRDTLRHCVKLDLDYIKKGHGMDRPSTMPSIETVLTPYKPKNIVLPLRKSDDELFLRELLNAILECIEFTEDQAQYIKHLKSLVEGII